jgi:hypothetical protein
MMSQGLTPGVENYGHAELGAEMRGIGGDGGERLSGRAEQDRRRRQLKTTSKYGTGNSSACRSASHWARIRKPPV